MLKMKQIIANAMPPTSRKNITIWTGKFIDAILAIETPSTGVKPNIYYKLTIFMLDTIIVILPGQISSLLPIENSKLLFLTIATSVDLSLWLSKVSLQVKLPLLSLLY